MKKRFSGALLALCLMALFAAFCPLKAAAYAYGDRSHIKYIEAVDVLSELGVMGGYGDDTFNPNGSLTRGAAAKIICKIALGEEDDSSLYPDETFPDVSPDFALAKYIAFCASHNYISGNNGYFNPGSTLTGNAFLKMLLCVIGYNQEIEKYSGEGWRERVMQQANETGLTEGLPANFDGTLPISREKAALLALNALQANQIEYVENFPGTAHPSTWSVNNTRANNINGKMTEQGKNIVQLAERLFPGLALSNKTDKDGNPTARWTLNGKTIGSYPRGFKITFDPNGGTIKNVGAVQMSYILVKYNHFYQTLPTATYGNKQFSGWYTSKTGGEKITADSRMKERNNQTLYAHWDEVSQIDSNALDDLTYSFENTAKDFNYTYGYSIPLQRYWKVFGENVLSKVLHDLYYEWLGNCYGMTSTAGMFHDKDVPVTDYRASASRPFDLTPTDSNKSTMMLVELIEAMQITQYGSEFIKEEKKNEGRLEKLLEEVRNFEQSGNNPVVICIYQENIDSVGYSGHAVLGYHVEETEDGAYIYVYDPNFPGDKERRICLYDNLTGWYYNLNNEEEWGEEFHGKISFIPYGKYLNDFNTWEKEGGSLDANLSESKAALNGQYVFMKLDATDARITDLSGSMVASFQKGRKVSGSADNYQVTVLGVTRNGVRASANAGLGVWLPVDNEYTIDLPASVHERYTVTLVNVNDKVDVSTTASSFTLSVKDDAEMLIQIHDKDCEYTATMTRGVSSDINLQGRTVGLDLSMRLNADTEMLELYGVNDSCGKLTIGSGTRTTSLGPGPAGATRNVPVG